MSLELEEKVDAIHQLVTELLERLGKISGLPKTDTVLLVTKQEAARRISRSVSTVKTLLRRGLLTPVKHGGGQTLITVRSLEAFASPGREVVVEAPRATARKRRPRGESEGAKIRAMLKSARSKRVKR